MKTEHCTWLSSMDTEPPAIDSEMTFEVHDILKQEPPAIRDDVGQSLHQQAATICNQERLVSSLKTVYRGLHPRISSKCGTSAAGDMVSYLFLRELCEDFSEMVQNKKSLYCRSLTYGRSIAVCNICAIQMVSGYNFLLKLIRHCEQHHPEECVQLTLEAARKHATTLNLMAKAMANDRHFITKNYFTI